MHIGGDVSYFASLKRDFRGDNVYPAQKNLRINRNGHEPRKEFQMKKNTSKENEISSNANEKLAREEQKRLKQAELTARESAESKKAKEALKALQTSDKRSAKNTYEAGKALQAIKEEKLYKFTASETKCSSFKQYVGGTFRISEQYAYMLINAARVQDILFEAEVASKYIPEKLLRRLTNQLKKDDGNNRIVEIWKAATKGKAVKIPTDKELSDVVAENKPRKEPSAEKSDSEILADPHSDDKEIIGLLRRVSTGKAHLSEDDLETLKDRLSEICDNAAPEND